MNAQTAADMLGIKLSALYAYIKRGRLAATKDLTPRRGGAFGTYDISPASLESFRQTRRRVGHPRTNNARAQHAVNRSSRPRLTDSQKLGILVARQDYNFSLKQIAAQYAISESGVCHVIRRNAPRLKRYAWDTPENHPAFIRAANGIVLGNAQDGFYKVILWTNAVWDCAIQHIAQELYLQHQGSHSYADCVADAETLVSMEISAMAWEEDTT